MKRRNTALAVLLSVAFVITAAIALAADRAAVSGDTVWDGESPNIVISEICTKNQSIIPDNNGRYRDYIELFNAGDQSVDLCGFSLANDKGKSSPLERFIIGPGEYRVLFLADELTGFALAASGGDGIQLLDPSGGIVTQATTASLMADQVMLYSDGIYTLSYDASPGFPNNKDGFSAFRTGSTGDGDGLVISELLTANISTLPDENGVYSDVAELCNTSGEVIELGGYCLSDSFDNRFRYRLPDIDLVPGAYLLIFLDGENYIGEGGEIHANFAVSAGESLCLTDRSGVVLSIDNSYHGDNISLSLGLDGTYSASVPSLGFSNTDEGRAAAAAEQVNYSSEILISEVLLSSAGVPYDGRICDAVEIVNVSGSTVDTTGWYLSDGGYPYEYALPQVYLKSGERLVIECGPDTTDFSLSKGETLRLTGPDFRHAPEIVCAGNIGESLHITYESDEKSTYFSSPDMGLAQGEPPSAPEGLYISELMSVNRSILKGAYGTTCDWVELHNAGDKDINLAGYYLSDDASMLKAYPLPDITVKSGEYCVVLLSEDSLNLIRGYEILPFALSSDGEQLYLSDENSIVDYVNVPALAADASYGRSGDGSFHVLKTATPEKPNSQIAEVSAMPEALTAQGVYDGVEYVDVVLSGPGKIYYTDSCYAPDAGSTLYTGPIRLTETTVIRAVCIEEGKTESEILDLSYIINEYDGLDVVSLVTEPSVLWDPNGGIYTYGPNADTEPPYYGANFWKDTELRATLSLFADGEDGFYAPCGIKIHGAFSRALAKKSISCSFKEEFGLDSLDYPVFGEEGLDSYEALILRSSGQDAFFARMRDVLITSLVAEQTNVPVQKYRPVAVYLCGEYWGLHYIREKANENYVAGNFNVAADDVILSQETGWNCIEYQELLEYVMEHDMSDPDAYAYMAEQMDIENYVDYIIAEIWIGNSDFGNIKYFKLPDKPWTWILYDTDLAFREVDYDSMSALLGRGGMGKGDRNSRSFAIRMFNNPEFKEYFLRRFAWRMENIWTEENIIARIDALEDLIAQDMLKDCEKWGESYEAWQQRVEALREFARERDSYVLGDIKAYFGLDDEELRSYGFDI